MTIMQLYCICNFNVKQFDIISSYISSTHFLFILKTQKIHKVSIPLISLIYLTVFSGYKSARRELNSAIFKNYYHTRKKKRLYRIYIVSSGEYIAHMGFLVLLYLYYPMKDSSSNSVETYWHHRKGKNTRQEYAIDLLVGYIHIHTNTHIHTYIRR